MHRLTPVLRQFRSSMDYVRDSRWVELLCIAAAVSVVWFTRFGFPASNNVYHVPIVLNYAGSAEGPHDAFHRSLAYFSSFFWPIVTAVATEQNIRSLFLILLIAASVLTIAAAYRLALAADATRATAAIGCSLLAFAFAGRQFMEYGNGELLSGFVTHSQFATAICLFAFALAVRERWILASFACGFAADINLFLGFWVMTNLLLARVVVDWQEQRRIQLSQLLLMGGACALVTAPAIVWALQALPLSGDSTFSFAEFLYQYEPHHSFTHLQLGPFANFLVLSLALWYCFRGDARSAQSRLLLLSVTALVVVLMGAAVVYFSDSRLLQSFYPLRYAAMAHWICAVSVVAVWADSCRRDTDRGAFGAIAVLGFCLPAPTVTLIGLLFLLPAGVRTGKAAMLLTGIAVSLLVPTFFGIRSNAIDIIRLGPLPMITLVGVGASALLVTCGDMRWSRRLLLVALLWLATTATLFAGRPIAPVLALLVVTAAASIAAERDKWAVPILIGGVVGLGVYVFFASNTRAVILGTGALCAATLVLRLAPQRWQISPTTIAASGVLGLCVLGLSQGMARSFDFPRWPLSDSWYDVQMWARRNTAPDTLFYSPDRGDFATMSRRPVWWDDIQGAAVMWDPSFYQEWNTRRMMAEKIRTMEELVTLARNEKISFIVVSRKRVGEIPAGGADVRYCNTNFCIAQIIDTSGNDQPVDLTLR